MMFNHETKLKYLDSIPEYKIIHYNNLFTRSYKKEEEYNKDIYDFDLNEIINLIMNLKGYTRSAIKTSANTISHYIDWAIENHFSKSKINPLADNRENWIDNVLKDKQQMITHQDFLFYTHYMNNFSDACLLWLLFEGVDGNKCDEIINLTKNDIDFDNRILTLHSKDKIDGVIKQRHLKVSKECIESIKLTINEEEYGFFDPYGADNKNGRKLVESDYILRPVTGKGKEKLSYQAINGRLLYIKENHGMRYLNRTIIRNSGIYYFAKEMILKNKGLTIEISRKLCSRYSKNFHNSEFIMISDLRRGLPLLYPDVSELLYPPVDLIKKRLSLITSRVRKSDLVEQLKKLYNNQCQVCGSSLILYEELAYSEVHHIHPLKDNGKDDNSNMIVLCPNHHKMFDIGILSLNDKGTKIIHIDSSDILNNQPLFEKKHDFDLDCVTFHQEQYFLPLKNIINYNK